MGEENMISVRRTVPENLEGVVQWIARPPRAADGSQKIGEVIEFYGELGLMKCNGELELGICVFHKRPLVLDQMELHAHTQELLFAIDEDFIAVAAPSEPGGGAPRLADLVALKVRRGEGLLFQKGCWHWAPYPFAEESFALVGFARGTASKDMLIRPLGRKITIVPE
jgi:hypothetical protein